MSRKITKLRIVINKLEKNSDNERYLKNAQKQAIFKILRLRYLKFQILTAYGLRHLTLTLAELDIANNGLNLYLIKRSSKYVKMKLSIMTKKIRSPFSHKISFQIDFMAYGLYGDHPLAGELDK